MELIDVLLEPGARLSCGYRRLIADTTKDGTIIFTVFDVYHGDDHIVYEGDIESEACRILVKEEE